MPSPARGRGPFRPQGAPTGVACRRTRTGSASRSTSSEKTKPPAPRAGGLFPPRFRSPPLRRTPKGGRQFNEKCCHKYRAPGLRGQEGAGGAWRAAAGARAAARLSVGTLLWTLSALARKGDQRQGLRQKGLAGKGRKGRARRRAQERGGLPGKGKGLGERATERERDAG